MYNVLIGNNALLEATVYIIDRKAFVVWFLLNRIVIIYECLFAGVCECVSRWLSSPTATQTAIQDVTVLCEMQESAVSAQQ